MQCVRAFGAAAAILALAAVVSARGQDRSAELVSALQLRPDQQAAYTAYLKATTPDPAVEALLRPAHARAATQVRHHDGSSSHAVSWDTVLGAASLIAAGGDWWISRRTGRRSWWPFWLFLGLGFALFSIFSPFGKTHP